MRHASLAKAALRRLSQFDSEIKRRAAAARSHIKQALEWCLEQRPLWWPWPGLPGIWQWLKLRPRVILPLASIVIVLFVTIWQWYSFEELDKNSVTHHPHADILNPI